MSGLDEQLGLVEAKRIQSLLHFWRDRIIKIHSELILKNLSDNNQDRRVDESYLQYWLPPYQKQLSEIIKQLEKCALSISHRASLDILKTQLQNIANLDSLRERATKLCELREHLIIS